MKANWANSLVMAVCMAAVTWSYNTIVGTFRDTARLEVQNENLKERLARLETVADCDKGKK